MRTLALAAAACLLLVPAAHASPVVGRLHVEGPVTFEGPTTTTAQAPLGAFIGDSSALTRLHGTWAAVTVRLYTETYVEAGTSDQHVRLLSMKRSPSWVVHDVDLSLAAPGTGWVGLHPGAGTLATTSERAAIDATATATIGTGGPQPDGSDPSQPYFVERADRPVLSHSATSWSYSGAGLLKIMGPSVVIRSRENTTTFVTGDDADGSDPTHATHRWLAIDFDGGTLEAGGATTSVLAPRAAVVWSGVARLASASGAVEGSSRAWRADAMDAAVLDGDLRADLAPEGDGRIAMDVAGELRDASLASHLVVPRPTDSVAWWPFALVGAVTGGAAAWAFAWRRRQLGGAGGGALVVGPEEFAQLASLAAERGDFTAAAQWALRAREQSPQSRRAAIDHAYFVAKGGDVARAASILRGPLLRDDPDAALVLVLLLLEHGDVPRAASALVDALHAHPELVLEVRSDPETAPLLARADVGRAALAASRVLERTGADEGT